jgi:hypothetical protein
MARASGKGGLIAVLVLFHVVMVASIKRPEEPRLFVAFCLMATAFAALAVHRRARE